MPVTLASLSPAKAYVPVAERAITVAKRILVFISVLLHFVCAYGQQTQSKEDGSERSLRVAASRGTEHQLVVEHGTADFAVSMLPLGRS
jgi:hypothetical protein